MKKWIIALALVVLPVAASAQDAGWSPPHRIETHTRANWFPSIGIDPWGTVHLVWSSGDGSDEDARDLLLYTRSSDEQWQPSNDIIVTGKGGWAARNSLVIDPSGRLHLLVRNRDGVYYASAAADEAGSAQAWQSLHRINGLGQPYYSAIAVDADGALHVVWGELSPQNETSAEPCAGCSDIWYRRSLDGGTTWSTPLNLSNATAGSIKPQIVLTPRGQIYVTWDEGKDPNAIVGEPIGIAYTMSDDRGATWQAVRRMTFADDAAQQAALAIDGTGRLLLVFRATASNTIVFRTSQDGGSWTEPAPLTGLLARDTSDTPWDRYSMATDSAGNVHLLAVARATPQQTRPALYHVVWNGVEQRWEQPAVISDDLYPEWPQLAIVNGNQLHAAWFTRSEADLHDSDNAAYQVWYSRRTVDAPAAPVTIQPTPTPTPAAPTPAPPTAVPPAPLADDHRHAPLPVSVRSERPLLNVLGLTLVPPLGLVVLALLVALRRRVM